MKTYALQAERVPRRPAGARSSGRASALYSPWMASMDEGWTRWMLERYGFTVVSLYPQDFRDAALAGRIDALIIADESRGAARRLPEGDGAARSTKAASARTAYVPSTRSCKGGGTLVCFNRATAFAIQQFALPVKNVVAGLKRQEFFTGGSVLEVQATDRPSR